MQTVTKSVFSVKYSGFRKLMVNARLSVGLTQAQLATRLQRPQSFVSKYERGERRLDIIEFVEVANALNLDLCDVVKQLDAAHRVRHKGRR